MSKVYFLCGDVGGTNSRLQLFELIDGKASFVAKAVYPSRKHAHLTVIITEFLQECKVSEPPLAACMAVAGPVKSNRCLVTNLV